MVSSQGIEIHALCSLNGDVRIHIKFSKAKMNNALEHALGAENTAKYFYMLLQRSIFFYYLHILSLWGIGILCNGSEMELVSLWICRRGTEIRDWPARNKFGSPETTRMFKGTTGKLTINTQNVALYLYLSINNPIIINSAWLLVSSKRDCFYG